jgi:hypothetical protein
MKTVTVTEAEFNTRRDESRRRREAKEREAKAKADSEGLPKDHLAALRERVGTQMYADLISTAGMRPTVRRAIIAALSLSSEETQRRLNEGQFRFADMTDAHLEAFITEIQTPTEAV